MCLDLIYAKTALENVKDIMINYREYKYIEDSFSEVKREDVTHFTCKFEYKGQDIFCSIDSSSKIRLDDIKEYIKLFCLNPEKIIKHFILIHKSIITPCAKKLFTDSYGLVVELFSIQEMQLNILRHVYVPEHIIVHPNETEYEDMLPFKKTLPILSLKDPVSRVLHLKKGQLVRINRHDSTIAYRIVK